MDEKKYTDGGIEYLQFNDPFFKRLFKTKNKYFREGIVICGKYYSYVFSMFEKNANEMKNELNKEIKEKKNIINELKKRYDKNKKTSKNNNEEFEKNKNEFVDDDLVCEIINVINEEEKLYNEVQLILEERKVGAISCQKMLGRWF